jgi:hypothetical protein
MQLKSGNRVPDTALRNFGLFTGLLFAVLFAAVPLLRGRAPEQWSWIASVLWLAALLWPRGLTLPYRWSMRLGQALAWFNTRVVLTLIFLMLITPFGFVMRVFGRDRMRRGFESRCQSYRTAIPPQPRRFMEKPF